MRIRTLGLKAGLLLAACAPALLPTTASAQSVPQRLILNGGVASNSVLMIGGQAYAPLADLARALGQPLVRVTGGYEIGAAGGANQVRGLQGKTGDALFNGAWRFKVIGVQVADGYAERHTQNGAQTWKADPGQKLVLVSVEVRNGQKFKTDLSLDQFDHRINNSLAGADGTSVAAKSYDLATEDGYHWGRGGQSDSTADLLPGAEQHLTLVFQAPQDFQPKDLLFTLAYTETPFGARKYSDLRVALGP